MAARNDFEVWGFSDNRVELNATFKSFDHAFQFVAALQNAARIDHIEIDNYLENKKSTWQLSACKNLGFSFIGTSELEG